VFFAFAGVLCLLVAGAQLFYKRTFPYGWSHCCIKGMMFALEEYAEANAGRYPAGESSAEASLSLLYRAKCSDAYTLRGMTVPQEEVELILKSGGLLGPATCGWHYEPGLTRADDPRLALLWCKEPLSHNGERTSGGREVVYVGGSVGWVAAGKWAGFLEEQEILRGGRAARAIAGHALVTGEIELPDGRRIMGVDGNYTLYERQTGQTESEISGGGESSGSALSASSLAYYQAPVRNGLLSRVLAFSNLVSDPVIIRFSDGVADVTNVVFKMRANTNSGTPTTGP
jgi:hypothetical protein